MVSDTWNLIFVDALFLALAGSLGVWFRAWIKGQKTAIDRGLEQLEFERFELRKLAERLERLCQMLEAQLKSPEEGSRLAGERRGEIRSESLRRRDGAVSFEKGEYEQAWRLLAQGLTAAEVARRLGLGMAEVELMARMLRYQQRR